MQRLNRTKKQLREAQAKYDKISECLREHYASNGNLRDEELLKMIRVNQISQAHLHISFLFASPLVVKYRTEAHTEDTRGMPLINFRREYDEMLQSLGETGSLVRYKKVHATIENLAHVLAERPVALHFSGHGIENSRENFGNESVLYRGQGNYFLVLEDSNGGADLISEKMLRELIESNKL